MTQLAIESGAFRTAHVPVPGPGPEAFAQISTTVLKPTAPPVQRPQTFNVLGVQTTLHVTGPETNQGLLITELSVPGGAGIPRHVHTRDDEVFHVLQGQIVFTLGERELTAGPQTTVFGPRGVPHAFRTAPTTAARLLVTIAPAGLETMFAELGALPPGPPDPARVAEIVGRYGISFV